MIDFNSIREGKDVHVIFECDPRKIQQIRKCLLEMGVDIDDIRIDKLDATRCKLSVEQSHRESQTDLIETQRSSMASHNTATSLHDVLDADSSPWIGLIGGAETVWFSLPGQDPLSLRRAFLDDLGYDDMVFSEALADCLWGTNYIDAVDMYDVACDQLEQAKECEADVDEARQTVWGFVALFQSTCEHNPPSIQSLVDLLENLGETNKLASAYNNRSLEKLKVEVKEEAVQPKQKEDTQALSHTFSSRD